MSLPSAPEIQQGPQHEREEERGQPGTENHCFNSHWISWLPRDFSSLRDTMDAVKMRNNGIRLLLSKCERRQWLVTNMLQSLPDHMKGCHAPTHIPDAFLVISGDRKRCLSYNGQGSECQTSCHSISLSAECLRPAKGHIIHLLSHHLRPVVGPSRQHSSHNNNHSNK